jgi:hypothetical protein
MRVEEHSGAQRHRDAMEEMGARRQEWPARAKICQTILITADWELPNVCLQGAETA